MSYSLLNPTAGNSPRYRLIPDLSFNPEKDQPKQEGPHLDVGTFSTPSFFDSSDDSSLNVQSNEPDMELYKDTFSAFVPDYKISPELKTAGVALSAFTTAKKLVNNIEQAEERGESTGEAHVCQTLRTLTEEISGSAMKGLVIGGIPPYLLAATTNPAVTTTVPFVLPMIPKAYQGADIAGQLLGQGVESLCHYGFDASRNLFQQEDGK